MYKLIFFVPESHLEEVKEALFKSGAGKIGNYSHCAWQVKPLPGSNPYSGEENRLKRVEEWRVELVVEKSKIKEVMTAFRAAHPYETPAYEVLEVLDF
mgnify:CR=1 FL=1